MSHAASKNIDGLTAIKEFLEKCYMHSKTAQNFPIIQQYEEPVRAQKPTFPKVHEKTVAFVSYSQKDKEFVSRMVADLKQIGLTIWWDKEILVGVNVPASIDQALKKAKVAILVLSKNSLNSEWAYTEWMAALNRAINKGSLTGVRQS
jgi:hypothetical protein